MTRVFISYSSKDRSFVEQLAKDLRANRVTPWYDQWEMLPGDSLTRKIGAAVLGNDYFVVLLSPNSVESEWVQRELALALHREFQERRVRTIPALLQDCDIPPFLRDKVYADFRSSYRTGLNALLHAIAGRQRAKVTDASIDSSSGQTVWDNVVGDNLTARNIIDDG